MEAMVARQPIFDGESHVQAYELLYRSETPGASGDEDRPTLEVLAGSLLTIGLGRLTGGKKAFVNFGKNLLLSGFPASLAPEEVVIEVLETAEPDDELIEQVRALRDRGFTIALDDFVWSPQVEPLAELAQIIKVDVRQTSAEEQQRLVDRYAPRGITMLAEKVETREEFAWTSQMGYKLFQGYFFARPAIISQKELEASSITCLQLLSQLQGFELNYTEIGRLISADLALAYKLFRYVNSALFARRGPIESVERGLAYMGEDRIRQWVTLATLPRLAKNKPVELVTAALLRARFEENLARMVGAAASSAYLTGLFSLLEAILDVPLAIAIEEAALPETVKDALRGASAEGPLGLIHGMAQGYEAGEWQSAAEFASKLKLTESAAAEAYVEAAEWTGKTLASWTAMENSPNRTQRTTPKAVRDRRRNARYSMGTPVAISWGGAGENGERHDEALLLEISTFGAKFRVPGRIPARSWVSFQLRNAGLGGRGVVRHCRSVGKSYEVGVEFQTGTGWKQSHNVERTTRATTLH